MRFRPAAVLLSVLASFPALAFAQEPGQGHALDAGINLGWAAGIVASDGGVTPANAVELGGDLTRAQEHVAAFRALLSVPPYDPAPFVAVERAIARLSSRIGGMGRAEAAREIAQIHGNLRSALSVFLSARTRRLVASPTCDSAILDVGFHFGEGQTSIQRGDAAGERRARDRLRRAIESGEQAARRLGCPFAGAAYRGLPMMTSPSADSYERALPTAQADTRRGRATRTGLTMTLDASTFAPAVARAPVDGPVARPPQAAPPRAAEAARPDISCPWSSSYGEIHWSDGWYGNRTKTLRGSLSREGDRWVFRGTWARTNGSRTGAVLFTFDSATSFRGYWTEGASGTQRTWTGSGSCGG